MRGIKRRRENCLLPLCACVIMSTMRGKVTILLVEDDVEMLEGIADLLDVLSSRYKMAFLKASNGKMALEIMASQIPDLIVSDIMMPQMEGFEFLQQVRQNPEWLHIPFVFLSARGKEGDIRRGRLSDADLYLTKPFATSELLELVETQLDRSFERKRHRDQALELLKKNMLQILNHEFRTPLTYVTAYYDMLESNLDGRNYRDYLRGIQAGCVRLTQLVSDLIQVVDLRSGLAAAHFEQRAQVIGDITVVLQRAIASKQELASEKSVQLLLAPAVDLPPVWGDAQSLQIVFEHLLDNAIKFSRPAATQPSQVHIRLLAGSGELRIAFEDQGSGIPAAMHQRVFDLFEQYNRGLMEQQGAGMGLTIAQGWVELHHGRIDLHSEEKQGSTFTIVLPAYQSNQQQVRGPGVGHGRVAATILLVEDEINLLHGLADLLTIYQGKYTLTPLMALNGRQGLELLQIYKPDLIISDIMMPQMNGYEFLKAVRENPQWAGIPFIFLTAKGERRDRFEGYRLGVEEYISKPYDTEDVLRYIEKQLDKHFQSQQTVHKDFESLKRSILKLVTPELMQPLTAVSIHTDRLAEGLEKTDSQEELSTSLREIQEGGFRLSRLIEDLITLAEIQTGETAVAYSWQAQPISGLGAIFLETGQALSRLYFPHVQLQYNFAESVPVIFGDSSMLMECVERFLKFIIQHNQQTPDVISLGIESEAGEALISVTAAQPLQAAAFTHWQHILVTDEVDLIDVPDYVASLHIVKQYVTLHQGRLTSQNSLESGCCFTIILPIYKPD